MFVQFQGNYVAVVAFKLVPANLGGIAGPVTDISYQGKIAYSQGEDFGPSPETLYLTLHDSPTTIPVTDPAVIAELLQFLNAELYAGALSKIR